MGAAALVVIGVAEVALVAAAVAGGGPLARLGPPLVAAVGVLAAVAVVAAVAASARPRIERVGESLRVRLALGRPMDVPLDIVECFFLGSTPLEPPGSVPDDVATHRIGTLVVRLAERAAAWQDRPTLAEWGSWHEGNIVCDGRWCEPLSADLVRSLTRRLVEAKRSVAEESAAAASRAEASPAGPRAAEEGGA